MRLRDDEKEYIRETARYYKLPMKQMLLFALKPWHDAISRP